MSIDSQTDFPGKFRQVVRINAHTLHADVTKEAGGEDSAPSPHDYFDASLATCKALTATWYAKKKGFLLDHVEAHVERDDSGERQGNYLLRVKLAYFGSLSESDKLSIHDAVSRCPIHKLMTDSTVTIETAPLQDIAPLPSKA